MTRPLQAASIAAPALRGLNTQDSSVTLEDGFALKADNCIIDKFGRLGSRKGWKLRTTQLNGGGSSASVNILGMHHFVDFTGAKTVISWNATTFYTGVNTLTPLSVENTTNDETISDGNWMAATLNDLCYFFQEGYLPLVYDPTGNGGSGSLTTLKDFAGGAYTNLPSAGFVMSAFGRLWAVGTTVNKTKIYFSSVNDGRNWDTGSAGSLDIASVFPKGTDTITGLAAQNGALVILCKNSIVVYDDQVGGFSGTITVATLTLADIIYGIGCIAAKTIVNTGEDVLFLDSTGVRSLGRTIQEKSRPMRDVSKNVRDDVISSIANTTNRNDITAVYSPLDAFYLLAFPALAIAYCFDTKGMLEDGSFRVTTWSNVPHKAYSFDPITDVIRIAQVAGIAEYMGYTDNTASYDMTYYTNHFDMGNSSATKILKNMNVTLIGATGQPFTIKIGTDYSSIYTSYSYTLSAGLAAQEYNPAGTSPLPTNGAEYGLSEYAGGVATESVRAAIGGSARILQAGFETTIDGGIMSLQKLDILTKIGRTI